MKKRNLLFFALLGLALVPGCNSPQKQELMSIEELKGNWQFRQAGDTAWLPAVVPGTVHTDLMAHGKIEDPYFRMNERQVQWIDKVNWEYRTILTVTPEEITIDAIDKGQGIPDIELAMREGYSSATDEIWKM